MNSRYKSDEQGIMNSIVYQNGAELLGGFLLQAEFHVQKLEEELGLEVSGESVLLGDALQCGLLSPLQLLVDNPGHLSLQLLVPGGVILLHG